MFRSFDAPSGRRPRSVERLPARVRACLPGLALAALLFAAVPAFAEDEAEAQAEAVVPAAPPPAAPVTERYKESVRGLIALSGPENIGQQVAYSVAQETLGAIAATGTPITEEMQRIVFEEAMEDFGARFSDLDHLTELYAPLYAQHMTQAEIQALLDFYATDAGKKSLAVLPLIAQSAMFALQQDSLARIPDFQERVDAELRKVGIVVAP